MRYHEFAFPAQRRDHVTEADVADAAQKRADRQIKARKKLADVRTKKADAARDYADRMRSANEKERSAQKALSKPPCT